MFYVLYVNKLKGKVRTYGTLYSITGSLAT